jgi:colanic acid/amylovoran biosynthesis glycosyltransferase
MPFRTFSYRNSARFYAVSKLGLAYIRERYTATESADYSYLGTSERGDNPFDPDNFTIATCAVIRPLKRVELVAEAVKLLDFPVTWYHLGGGSEAAMKNLESIAAQYPAGVKAVFKGQISQPDLFKFYNTVPVSVLLNMSNTEGLPVAVMEATSVGIPVLATDVGGTAEIVNDETGWLLPVDITPEQLADKIKAFRTSTLNTEAFRKRTKLFWKEHFYAEKNYSDFCEKLIKLK